MAEVVVIRLTEEAKGMSDSESEEDGWFTASEQHKVLCEATI